MKFETHLIIQKLQPLQIDLIWGWPCHVNVVSSPLMHFVSAQKFDVGSRRSCVCEKLSKGVKSGSKMLSCFTIHVVLCRHDRALPKLAHGNS